MWRKASLSTSNGGNCVELAALPGLVAIRDSKDAGGPMLTFGRNVFRAFVAEVKRR